MYTPTITAKFDIVTKYRKKRFSAIYRFTMSGKGSGKSVSNNGTNSQGDSYTSYTDGGYAYKNSSGSSYYRPSEGAGFYNSGPNGTQSSGGQPYTTSYNYNKGTSNTYTKK